jgi:hypothetical protein
MMRRAAMAGRLPPVWSAESGTMLDALLSLVANELTAFDEDMDRVRRAHWVDTAWDLVDLARIGSLFGIAPAAWEGVELFRERLKAVIAAHFRGAVTADALEHVVLRILKGVERELEHRYLPLPPDIRFGERILGRGVTSPPARGRIVEFPLQRRRSPALSGKGALRQPLAKFALDNKGVEPAALLGSLTGVAGGRTVVPVLVNLTTGRILLWAGVLACGQRLSLSLDGDGRLLARVGDRDVSHEIWAGDGFVPGTRFQPVRPDPEPRPLMLARGVNRLWFWPLGLYDAPGLDSAVFASPAAELEQGRWAQGPAGEGSRFDSALFEQPPAVSLDLFWDERQAAAFRIELPTGVVARPRSRPGRDPEIDRAQLFQLLGEVVADLRAAGVDGRVSPLPLQEVQRLESRATMLSPVATRETQRLEGGLGGISALFDTTAVDGARLE